MVLTWCCGCFVIMVLIVLLLLVGFVCFELCCLCFIVWLFVGCFGCGYWLVFCVVEFAFWLAGFGLRF